MGWHSPLAQLLRQIQCCRSQRAFWIALVPILLVTVALVCLPFSRGVQRVMMQRFHLASPSFAAWAVLQPVPSMYSFANEVWLSDFPMSEENLRKYPQLARKAWCNHFPMQWMTFRPRAEAPVAPYREFFHVCSSYGENRLFSRVELTKETPEQQVSFTYEEVQP